MAPKTVETTEVVLRDGSKALVPQQFAMSYPGFAPDEETLELLAENLGDDGAMIGVRNFPRVKVPGGEVSSWMIKQGGKEVAQKRLRGVMVGWSARRSLWTNGEPDGSPPDCASIDNKRPLPGGLYAPDGERGDQNPSGMCANCPMAQFGSDPKGHRGAACKEQRLVYVIIEGALFPLILHIPRTSIASLSEFMIGLLNMQKRYYQVVIDFFLEKAKNKDGQEYNQVVLEVVEDLGDAEMAAVKVYVEQVKGLIWEFNASFTRESVADSGENGYSMGEPVPA
jgi:hypothetical protein